MRTLGRKLYGRRKGRPISARRAEIVARLANQLIVDISAPALSGDLERLFLEPVDEVRLEIGCGAGEHLISQAMQFVEVDFIGVEPFQEGLAKTIVKIDMSGCHNVRLYDDDAALLMDWLPAKSLTEINLLFPDPWPKKRHRKRRFISSGNLDLMARTLRPGGLIRIATDSGDYADWTLAAFLHRNDFRWTARSADDWRLPWPGWPGTRYEAKAIAAGRRPIFLTFRRISDPPDLD